MKIEILLPPAKIYRKFKKVFGADLSEFQDKYVTLATGKFFFDVFKFEQYCREKWHFTGIFIDFITQKFGKKAIDLISYLQHF